MRTQTFSIKAIHVAMLAFVMLGISGCGSGPSLYSVSGTLLHNETPLPEMQVTFRPVDGSKTSSGMTDKDGKFTLSYSMDQEGVTAGEHLVEIDYLPSDADVLVAYQAGDFSSLPAHIKTVVEKYDDPEKSPYRVTIDSNQTNLEVNLD